MGVTANYSFPYPELGDPPDGPSQISALAIAVDTALDGVDDRVDNLETGTTRLLGRARRITNSSGSTSTTAVGVLRIDNIAVISGRAITVRSSTLHPTSTVTTDTVRLEIRYTTTGVAATTASAVLPGAQAFELFGNTTTLETTYVAPASQTLSLLLCVAREVGSGTASLFADANRFTEFKIYDDGNDPGDTGVDI